jgi:ribonucleoside-diphosphate reductase alpha chain
MNSKILEALDMGDLDLARDILLEEIYHTVGNKRSWDSPQYRGNMILQEKIVQDKSRDKLFTFFGLEILRDRYLLRDKEGIICETPQEFIARVSAALARKDQELARGLYDDISNHYFMPATPILTNIGTNRGLPISCFLNTVPDDIEGIYDIYAENAVLAKGGGGIGSNWADVRGINAQLKTGGKSTGTIPFLKVMDSSTLAVNQGGVRRGSAAAYLDISHPDIEEFITIRKPTGGDENRKCLNLHHGINVTDKFMKAVKSNADFNLTCPNTGETVKVVKARDLWRKILQTRVETGEPYLLFIDTVNKAVPEQHRQKGLMIKQSNLCCCPAGTLILTDKGYKDIEWYDDRYVTIWNGFEWSQVKVLPTGDKRIHKVTLSDGSFIECSDNHKFHIQKGYDRGTGKNKLELDIVELKNLKVGDKLQKCEFPVIDTTEHDFINEAYAQGFYSGDGCYYNDKQHIDLYGDKLKCIGRINPKKVFPYQKNQDRTRVLVNTYDKSKEFVPYGEYSIKSKLSWLAGLADSDGCITDNGGTNSLQISSINLDFLRNVKLMLNELGTNPKIAKLRDAEYREMPDGKGGTKEYFCQTCYRLIVSAYDLQELLDLGLEFVRLEVSESRPNRDARQFVEVVSIEDTGRVEETYCFNEPKNHTGIFNGVYTGQSEITLPTNEERTAVCCLGSINLERWNDMDNKEKVVKNAVAALDNVLDIFIKRAESPKYLKARYSAAHERSIGLGVMGWHGYLMREGLSFGSPAALAHNRLIFERIKNAALRASAELANEKSPPLDGGYLRNTYLLAIAPTANISIICGGATPGIEPIAGNAFLQKTLSGSFLVKNKYLERVLESMGKNTRAVWESIISNGGSVAHVDFLNAEQKNIFKTAYEIDMNAVVRQAAERQKYICQAQSLNLFFQPPLSGQYINQVHLAAWEQGCKSLYYLRSDSAIKATKVSQEDCEACQ